MELLLIGVNWTGSGSGENIKQQKQQQQHSKPKVKTNKPMHYSWKCKIHTAYST